MFKQRCEEYLKLIEDSIAGRSSVEVVMQETVSLMKDLKQQLETAQGEEREELLKVLRELQTKMQQATKKVEKITGLSESDLIEYAKNASHFSRAQWDSIEGSKQEIQEKQKEISSILKHPASPESPEKAKRTKRQSWIKS